MKRRLFLSLSLVLIICLTACSGSKSNENLVSKRPTVVVCETDDLESTTSLNTDGQNCTIEYVSVSKNKELTSYDKGPLSGSIDKDRYDRIITVLNTIGNNRAEFSAKAEQFSQVNKAYPSFDTLFNSMLTWYALYANHDDKTTDDAAKALWEADTYLADIEQIAEHGDIADNYVFTCENVERMSLPNGAKAGIADDGRYVITDYYDVAADPELHIVDYQTYVDTWNFYTNHAELPFDDPDKDYAIYAYIDDSANVDVWIDGMTVDHELLNTTIFTDANGAMASGTGKFLVIPVLKGTKIGETKYIHPAYKESPMYNTVP